MRRVLWMAALSVTLLHASVSHAAFPDVQRHWSRRYVEPLVAREILTGYPDGRFYPDREMSREEFLRVLVASFAQPLPAEVMTANEPVYRDVGSDRWSRPFVEAAWELGWIEGNTGGRFEPDRPMTRVEAAELLVRAAKAAESGSADALVFSDVGAIPAESRAVVATAVQEQFLTGYVDGTFRPLRPITRGETAAMVQRVLASRGRLYHGVGELVEPPAVERGARQDVRLSIRLEGETSPRSIRVGPEVPVWRNGRQIPPGGLQQLDEIAVIFREGVPVFVEAQYVDGIGVLRSVTSSERTFRFLDTKGRLQEGILSENAQVFRNGRPAKFSDLERGDLLYLVYSRKGTVRFLDAVRADIRGNVWDRYDYPGGTRLRIGRSWLEASWVEWSEEAPVFLDGRRTVVNRLQVGDEVIASLADGKVVTYVEAYRHTKPPR